MELIVRRAAPYVETWEWQKARARAVASAEAAEALMLVEHTPVYTLGQRSDPAHLGAGEAALRAAGADVVWVDRGGDVTWHGPGQVTGYPILDLKTRGKDLHRHVHTLEETLIELCATYGVVAARRQGMPGVWVDNRKIGALGVKVDRSWVSYHGFALNVSCDVRWFERIVPCGLHGFAVTSLERELKTRVEWEEVAQRLARAFAATPVQSPRLAEASL
ncbi:MAG TPA: lipoyl(octanoyl) transferase LipB [Chloroflexota bacterium]|nr:lipoyl(octanoyl) transferase LipB [Chloroflexota bacterium]